MQQTKPNSSALGLALKQKTVILFQLYPMVRFIDSLVGGYATARNGCGEQEPPVVGDWTEWEGCSGESLGTKMAKCWAEGFQAATKGR